LPFLLLLLLQAPPELLVLVFPPQLHVVEDRSKVLELGFADGGVDISDAFAQGGGGKEVSQELAFFFQGARGGAIKVVV